MAGEHFPAGPLLRADDDYLPDDLMGSVERNVVYACTDVALRNPATGEIFLGTRQTEPQLGPWFIGGRNKYGVSPAENAVLQVKNDLGLEGIPPSRFKFLASYSTPFPAASPGRQDHGRHTVNSTMLLDLNPEEVSEINARVRNSEIRDEYSEGHWYNPVDIAKPDSDFPDTLRQFVRDLHDYDQLYAAKWDEAHKENALREIHGSPEDREKEILISAARLEKTFGLTSDEAYQIAREAGPNASYAILWARTVSEEATEATDLVEIIRSILKDEDYMGDYLAKKTLRARGITAPEVMSDNGPALRAILRGSLIALEANKRHDGEIFKNLSKVTFLGRAGVGSMDPQ